MSEKSKLKVIRVPIPTPTLLPYTTTNSFLIGNDQESVLVDAGYDIGETRRVLEKAVKENELATPKSIILTHSHKDHAPGVRQLMEWSPTVYCHENEKQGVAAAISPLTKISTLKDDHRLIVAGEEITILHAPGHTSGQLNLYIPAEQALIAGDNIVAEGTSWIGAPDGDMRDYLQTLERLRQLKLTKIGPGHGKWIQNPYEHIGFIINRRLQREDQIMSFLKKYKRLNSSSLTKMIYKDTIHPSIFEVAKRTTEAHLVKLMKEGSVASEASRYFIKG